jgi:hypothetical protein
MAGGFRLMNPFAAHRTIASLCSMFVFTATCSCLAQEVIDTQPTTAQQYQQVIEVLEEEGRANDAALVEPLTALSQFHLEQEEYELAAEGFARARGIVRVNHGISSMQEIELLSWEVRAHEAANNLTTAWELEQNMLMMLRDFTGVPATYPIYSELAAKRLDVLQRYRAGDYPPQIVLGCYYGKARDSDAVELGDTLHIITTESEGHCAAGNRNTVLITLLREARNYQALAIEALLQDRRYASAELMQLMTDFLRSSDRLRSLMPQYGDSFLSLVLNRVIAYPATDPASMRQKAMLLIQLADLNVRRGYGSSRPAGFDNVLTQYQLAYTQLENAGLKQEELDAIFSPTIPIMLPAFDSNPLLPSEGTSSDSYIDVAFNVTRYGRGRDVEIVGASEKIKRGDRRELTRLIKENTFRPRMTNGEFADSTAATVRYYLQAAEQD